MARWMIFADSFKHAGELSRRLTGQAKDIIFIRNEEQVRGMTPASYPGKIIFFSNDARTEELEGLLQSRGFFTCSIH